MLAIGLLLTATSVAIASEATEKVAGIAAQQEDKDAQVSADKKAKADALKTVPVDTFGDASAMTVNFMPMLGMPMSSQRSPVMANSVVTPPPLEGNTVPGLVEYLNGWLLGNDYNACGLFGSGCLTIDRANFNYSYLSLILNLVQAPNVLDLNGNQPANHLTLIGSVHSDSYLQYSNSNYTGNNNNANCIIIGLACTWQTNAAQNYQVLIGDGAYANGSNTVVLGTNARHQLPNIAATTPGGPDTNYASRLGNAVVIGNNANGTANRQTIVGADASSTHANSVAIGANSTTTVGAQTNYQAFGLTALQTSAGEFSIGSATAARKLTNVAAGTSGNDAVNVAQLQGALADIGVFDEALAVQYDDDGAGNPLNSITLQGDGSGDPVSISNLSAGEVIAGSTDAVNGDQLAATNTAVVDGLGAGAAFDSATGTFTAPDYAITGIDADGNATPGNYNNAGDAFDAVNGSIVNVNSRVDEIYADGSLYVQVNSAGPGAQAIGTDSTAIGPNAVANGTAGIAMGLDSLNYNAGGIAIGRGAVTGDAVDATRINTVAIGNNARATAQNSTALGDAALATGPQSTALGSAAQATGSNSTAIGRSSRAGNSGTALGATAQATGTRSTALGQGAVASAADATAIGQFAQATATNSVAIGLGSLANRAGSVSVGAAGAERQITNVAAGTAATDAVNVSQLDAVSGDVGDLDAFAVKYDDDGTGNPDTGSITLAGAGGTTIANLAAGAVDATSTEAINGAQLFGVSDSVATALGGNAIVNPDGSVSAPAYTIGGQVYDNVGDAFTAVDGIATDVGELDAFAVKYDDDGTGNPDTSTITLTGAGGTTLANLAAGAVDATSTEAINGAQLFGASDSVATALGGNAVVNPDGSVSAPAYTIDGQVYDNVGDAFTAVDGIATDVGDLDAFAVKYDDDGAGNPDTSRITLSGAGGTTIANVAPGVADDEAVNVGQLSPVVAGLGGGAAIDPATGVVTGPTYTLDDGSNSGATADYGNVGDALGNLDGRVVDNTAAIADLANNAGLGLVRQDPVSGVIAIGSETFGDEVSLANEDGDARRLSGVAAGTEDTDALNVGQLRDAGIIDANGEVLAVAYDTAARDRITLAGAQGTVVDNVAAGAVTAASNEAINGAQLYGFGNDIATAFGGGASFSGGTFVAPAYAIQGASYTNVGAAFAAVNGQITNLYNAISDIDTTPGPAGPQGPTGPQGPEGPAGGGPRSVVYDDDAGSTLTLKGEAGTRISNLADGVAVDDAVNKGQMDAADAQTLSSANTYTNVTATNTLNQANAYTDQRFETINDRFDNLEQRFRGQDRRMDRIGAMTGALTGMAMNSNNQRGPNNMAVGVGSQGGSSALAVGYRRVVNEAASVSVGAAFSDGENTLSAGAGFSW